MSNTAKRIQQAIQANPGVKASGILRLLGLPVTLYTVSMVAELRRI